MALPAYARAEKEHVCAVWCRGHDSRAYINVLIYMLFVPLYAMEQEYEMTGCLTEVAAIRGACRYNEKHISASDGCKFCIFILN